MEAIKASETSEERLFVSTLDRYQKTQILWMGNQIFSREDTQEMRNHIKWRKRSLWKHLYVKFLGCNTMQVGLILFIIELLVRGGHTYFLYIVLKVYVKQKLMH